VRGYRLRIEIRLRLDDRPDQIIIYIVLLRCLKNQVVIFFELRTQDLIENGTGFFAVKQFEFPVRGNIRKNG